MKGHRSCGYVMFALRGSFSWYIQSGNRCLWDVTMGVLWDRAMDMSANISSARFPEFFLLRPRTTPRGASMEASWLVSSFETRDRGNGMQGQLPTPRPELGSKL